MIATLMMVLLGVGLLLVAVGSLVYEIGKNVGTLLVSISATAHPWLAGGGGFPRVRSPRHSGSRAPDSVEVLAPFDMPTPAAASNGTKRIPVCTYRVRSRCVGRTSSAGCSIEVGSESGQPEPLSMRPRRRRMQSASTAIAA